MRDKTRKSKSKRAAPPGDSHLSGPSLRMRRKGESLPLPRAHDVVKVENHRQLLVMARTLSERLEEDPQFSVMLLANPVLALEHYGIELNADMRRHVLETLRHPPKLRARRKELEESLEKVLGEAAKPNDAAWMAKLVFELRGLKPLDTTDATPAYKSPLNGRMIARLQELRPPGTNRYQGARRSRVKAAVGVAPRSPSVRLLDVEAKAPKLPPSAEKPENLTLEEAWFYNNDPVVRDAVELGQIERRAFPFRTPAQFRDLIAGKNIDAFGAFVRTIRVPDAAT